MNSPNQTSILRVTNEDFEKMGVGSLQRYAMRGLIGSSSLATRRMGTMVARDEGTICSLSIGSRISSSLGSIIDGCRATRREPDLGGGPSLLPLELAIYSKTNAKKKKKLQMQMLLWVVVTVVVDVWVRE